MNEIHNVNLPHKTAGKFKNIVLSLETYLQLKTLGQTGDSFNDVVKNLIAEHGGKS
jgi:predicted CopG family antitoxin